MIFTCRVRKTGKFSFDGSTASVNRHHVLSQDCLYLIVAVSVFQGLYKLL